MGTGRAWPVWLGSGMGLGMGYANCQNDLRNPFLLHGRKVKVDDLPYSSRLLHTSLQVAEMPVREPLWSLLDVSVP